MTSQFPQTRPAGPAAAPPGHRPRAQAPLDAAARAQLSLFRSPAKPRGILWGVGPIVSFPSATEDVLGTGKYSVGPTAAALAIEGPWVVGALVNNLFSVGSDSKRRDVNQMLVQPFVHDNLPGGWYLTSSPIITADWKADADQRWTVPVGGGIGKIFRIGKQPLNASLQTFYNAVRPDQTGDVSVRFEAQFLFPK